MPAPVPLPVRQALFDRHGRGESTAELAAAFGLAPRTVRGLLRRGRLGAGTHWRPTPSALPQPPREAARADFSYLRASRGPNKVVARGTRRATP
jgi:hypothetical protein